MASSSYIESRGNNGSRLTVCEITAVIIQHMKFKVHVPKVINEVDYSSRKPQDDG
jgi:hypothetical protein